jgi:hypothetical protein
VVDITGKKYNFSLLAVELSLGLKKTTILVKNAIFRNKLSFFWKNIDF